MSRPPPSDFFVSGWWVIPAAAICVLVGAAVGIGYFIGAYL